MGATTLKQPPVVSRGGFRIGVTLCLGLALTLVLCRSVPGLWPGSLPSAADSFKEAEAEVAIAQGIEQATAAAAGSRKGILSNLQDHTAIADAALTEALLAADGSNGVPDVTALPEPQDVVLVAEPVAQEPQLQVPGEEQGEEGEHSQREQEFSKIYAHNIWASRESRSGSGSEAGYTVNIRRFMSVAFKAFKIKSLLDSPCGDCNWQPLIPGFNQTQYTGIDIVKSAIEDNKQKFKDRPNMQFFAVDVASQPVPPGDYDAVLCRDMIQHLPLKAGLAAYRTLEKSGAKYLLTSFHSAAKANSDIKAGDFRLLDPMLPPFNFSKPIMYALEGMDTFNDNYKMIGLWRFPALGQGKGKSINPINPESHKKSIIASHPEAVKKLKSVGFKDYVCHSAEYCSKR